MKESNGCLLLRYAQNHFSLFMCALESLQHLECGLCSLWGSLLPMPVTCVGAELAYYLCH